MQFKRVEDAIDVCKKHVGATSSAGSEAEAYLSAYLLVIIYAEYETKIKQIVACRIARCVADGPLHAFVQSYFRRATGRIGIAELRETLLRFGKTVRAIFDKEILDNPPHNAWDSIMTNRHNISHNLGPNAMPFTEIERAYQQSHQVLSAFARAMGLTAVEIANL